MRIGKVFIAGGILALTINAPARAVGLDDLAKVVLGGGSVLKKGQEKCGSTLGLTQNDSLAITFARAAAERALPISQFTQLDQAAEADALKQAETPTFCPETKQKKSGLMKAIKKAGKSILMTRVLGG
jgi:antitoxin component of RelBE/YafQ-DinJ toxin-antitoxin module